MDAGVIDWWAYSADARSIDWAAARGPQSTELAMAAAIDGCSDARVVEIARHGAIFTIVEANALRILSLHPAMSDRRTLVYLDPPYLESVRTRLFYDHEFETQMQHECLLRNIDALPCYVMISHYDCELYRSLLCPPKWRHISYNAMTRGGLRREFLWMNFPEGLPLHDIRFVGEGFRERERIGRKRDRWRRRFQKMPAAERQVIREALAEVD